MTEKEKIRLIVNETINHLWEALKDKYIDGLGIGGSFARGDYSISRPDVNLIVFVKKDAPELYLKVADVFDRFSEKFREEFNIRPRSEPERPTFAYKRDKAKKDIFFKISFLQLALKDKPDYPFGRPPFVLESHAKSLKMIHGRNHLVKIRVTCSNLQILEITIKETQDIRKILPYTPSSYDLTHETDLFFNEALAYGKLLVQRAIWVAGLAKGMDFAKKREREKVLAVGYNKESLRKFLAVLGGSIIGKVNVILDSRLHYDDWKNDLSRAQALYQATYRLGDKLIETAQNILKNSRTSQS